MRYIDVETVSFTDSAGRTVAVREMREPKRQQAWFSLDLAGKPWLDEIASTEDIYGRDGESLAYKIFDHNREGIVDMGFDLSKLKTLEVPL